MATLQNDFSPITIRQFRRFDSCMFCLPTHRFCLAMMILLAMAGFVTEASSQIKSASPEGRRVALVIGNGAYQSKELPKLKNPVNDAQDIAAALKGFGFEVLSHANLSRRAMKDAIAEFGRRSGNAEAALFYYAGHGVQIRNQNYLIPIDATVRSEADLIDEAVSLNLPLDEMDGAKSRINIVMLDACRDNPITGKFRSAGGRGLAPPSGNTPKGTVIIYATDPGNTALDGEGRNGVFTAGLLAAFKGKDLSLDSVLTIASEEVEKSSKGLQTPYVNGPQLVKKNFHFASPKGGDENFVGAPSAPTHAAKDGPNKSGASGDSDTAMWSDAKTKGTREYFEVYLKQFPRGKYAALARVELKRFNDKQATTASTEADRPQRAHSTETDRRNGPSPGSTPSSLKLVANEQNTSAGAPKRPAGSVSTTPECSKILQRASLGEALTPQEQSRLRHQCQ